MRAKPFTEIPGQRQLRSFVLRQGRQTEAQKRAFELHWPRHGLDYQGEVRDFDAVFARRAERVVEIGFGNGEQLLHAAQHETARDFIGIEVHGPGVGRTLNGAAALDLHNLRIYQHDAVEVLKHEIADAALDEVRVYFPDPWHKKRHHKRRLLNADFIALSCSKLRVGGLLHLATDWEDYAEQMREVCEAQPLLRNKACAGQAVERPSWRLQTHFETRGLKLGHGVWDFLYRRV